MSILTDKKIGVLMAGISSEREISLKTGKTIEAALKKKGYNVIGIDVGRDIADRLKKEAVEIAFIALHGRYGEDGTIQGLLEVMGIPYTGSGVLSSAIAINKIITKRLLEYHQIPTPRYTVLKKNEGVDYYRSLESHGFEYPVVVKPSSECSTIGVSIARDKEQLLEAVGLAFSYGNEILMEEYIDGREITVGILDNTSLPVIEIVPKEEFYDYRAKYTKGMTEYIIPARLSDGLYKKVQGIGLKVYQVLGCKGVSRVDMRVDREDHPYVLEINTVPGMTETSLIPIAARETGIDFPELVEKILESAMRKE